MMISPETLASETEATLQEIVVEGKRLLENGDKPRALAHFVMASRLSPLDEDIWLLRANATSDPIEAAACLDQVLAINPKNTQVSDRLTFFRVQTLQHEAKVHTRPIELSPGQKLVGWFKTLGSSFAFRIFAIFTVIVLMMGFAVAFIALSSNARTEAEAVAERVAPATATPGTFLLPPTWTPVPTRAPTRTLIPTPIPIWQVARSITARSGPSPSYPALGTVRAGSSVAVMGRSADGKYIQIQYPDRTKLAWISSDVVGANSENLAALSVVTAGSPPPSPRPPSNLPPRPTTAPPPTFTPVSRIEFALGRQPQNLADCSRSWKILGTVYDSPTGARRLNGILVRVWAFGQLQGTMSTGASNPSLPGYWEWSFNQGSEITGQVAIVSFDGSLRSQPVSYHLTARCDGAGAVNQVVLDFVGGH